MMAYNRTIPAPANTDVNVNNAAYKSPKFMKSGAMNRGSAALDFVLVLEADEVPVGVVPALPTLASNEAQVPVALVGLWVVAAPPKSHAEALLPAFT